MKDANINGALNNFCSVNGLGITKMDRCLLYDLKTKENGCFTRLSFIKMVGWLDGWMKLVSIRLVG